MPLHAEHFGAAETCRVSWGTLRLRRNRISAIRIPNKNEKTPTPKAKVRLEKVPPPARRFAWEALT